MLYLILLRSIVGNQLVLLLTGDACIILAGIEGVAVLIAQILAILALVIECGNLLIDFSELVFKRLHCVLQVALSSIKERLHKRVLGVERKSETVGHLTVETHSRLHCRHFLHTAHILALGDYNRTCLWIHSLKCHIEFALFHHRNLRLE